MTTPILVSSAIFVACLGLIFTEKVNRVIVGLAGAILMMIAGRILNFYTEEQAISAIDWNTLGLLMGMMVLVSLLEPTGFFQFLAVWAGRVSQGRPFLLLVLLGSVTTVLSMVLDNVTTVVLIAPITILICEVLGISATPYLLSEALLSNTGGVATLVGDPPNVLIASAAHFSFATFLTHALPVVVLAWVAALFLLRFLFRTELSQTPPAREAVLGLDPREALDDPRSARRGLIVLLVAILLFFLENQLKVSTSFIAMGAAAAGLAWIRPPVAETFKRIEWSVLVFFGALFIMVGGLEHAGVFDGLIHALLGIQKFPPVLLGVLLIWIVAVLSAVVDNVPITIALIPVILGLGEAGMQINALWWALVFGAGFGGNATIIGSSANIVVATLSERTRTPITGPLWLKRGLPMTLLTCTIASIFFVLAYPLFTR